jgi:hypothetical protein
MLATEKYVFVDFSRKNFRIFLFRKLLTKKVHYKEQCFA